MFQPATNSCSSQVSSQFRRLSNSINLLNFPNRASNFPRNQFFTQSRRGFTSHNNFSNSTKNSNISRNLNRRKNNSLLKPVSLGFRNFLPRYFSSAAASAVKNTNTMGSVSQQSVSAIDKPMTDHRNYRHITLPNGLKAMLVSDDKCDKSAACLSVKVGSLFDGEIQGLAHFCEHMLFLGTKKYPKEDDYNEFLAKHGGMSNAYTSTTQTVFYFDVGKDHLEPAIDRFAQFFLEPLFTETATDRELNAVHSEHTKNMQSDNWRVQQILRNGFNPEHTMHRFTTGNLETLKEYPEKKNMDLRDILLKFHDEYYSSNVMTMSVLGKESLDDLEKVVRGNFSAVANKNITIPEGSEMGKLFQKEAGKHVEPLRESDLKTMQIIVPVKDMRSVTFEFKLPEQNTQWEKKPARYLAHLLGHEGEGSVLSVLKQKGLATELCAGAEMDEGGVCWWAVDIHLTEEGEKKENIELIGEILFSYIKLLKEKDGINSDVFDEMRNIDSMGFKFRSLPDPTSAVVSLATGMQEKFPPEKIMSAPYMIWEYDNKLANETLDMLTLDNLRVRRIGKRFANPEVEPDANLVTETEYFYNAKHSPLLKLPDDFLSTWGSPRMAEKDFDLKIMPKNPFVPEKLDFKKLEEGEASTNTLPKKYDLNLEGFHAYHLQDSEFKLPKAVLGMTFYSPFTNSSPKNMMLTEILSQCIAEELNEYAYDAELAGLSYKMSADVRGFCLEVGGYDDKLGVLLAAVAKKINSMDSVKEETWNLVHQRMERDLLNAASKRQPYMQAVTWLRRANLKDALLFEEKLEIFNSLKREDLDGLNKRLLESRFVECLAQGNITRTDTRSLLEKFVIALPKQNADKKLSKVEPVQSLLQKEKTHFRIRVPGTNPDEGNGSSAMTLQIGQQELKQPKEWMMANMYSQIASQKMFDDLRTKQQLGYIVAQQASKNTTRRMEMLFLVQSESVAPWECTKRITTFIDDFRNNFISKEDQFTRESFETYKNALIEQLEEKPKKLADQFVRFWQEVKERTNDFEKRERSIKCLKEDLTYEDFVNFAKSVSLESCPSTTCEIVPTKFAAEEPKADDERYKSIYPTENGQPTHEFKDPKSIDSLMRSGETTELGVWLGSESAIEAETCVSRL